MQVVSLQQGELKWLANHMGHDVDIHESIYRVHDSSIELAKVSRLLMAVDRGEISKFAGRSLADIEPDGKYFCHAIFAVRKHTCILHNSDTDSLLVCLSDSCSSYCVETMQAAFIGSLRSDSRTRMRDI